MKTIVAACNSRGYLTGFRGHIPWIRLTEWCDFLTKSAHSSNLPVVLSGTPEEVDHYGSLLQVSGIQPDDILDEDDLCLLGSNEGLFQEALSTTRVIFLARIDMNLHDGPMFPGIPKEFRRASYYCERTELPTSSETDTRLLGSSPTTIVPVTFEHWIRRL
jgi:hypothetical protein